MHNKFGIGLAVFLCIQGAAAEDAPFKGEGELGFTQTSGNTDTQSLVAKLAIKYTTSSWEHEAKLDALRAEEDNVLNAERYELNLQSNYLLSDKSYLFAKLRYEDDSFNGYDYQTSLNFGYGNKLIDTERTGLKIEAGVGVRQFKLDTVDSESDEEMVGYAGLNYRQKIGSHSEFTQDIEVEGGSDNIYTQSDTGFKVNIMDNLAMKLSLSVKNNSEVPPDTEKTDTLTAVTLVYSF